MSSKRAIIDIGSNTIRLVVYNGPKRAPIVLLNEKVAPRFGKDVEEHGALSEGSVEVALDALARFAAIIEMLKVDDVQAVATAAVRDASNGEEFIAAVRDLGLDPRVLSGEEEACTSAMGVIAAFPDANGVMGDLGGGSLELTQIADKACGQSITLPFGTLRLPPLRATGDEAFAAHVKKSLKATGWKTKKAERLYIAGGSWRALALYAMHKADWPLEDPHDFVMQAEDAQALCTALAKDGATSEVDRISSSRLASLPDAAALLGVLIDKLAPSRIVFSSWGLREGLLFTSLEPETQALDPVLSSITTFAEGYMVMPAQARRVDAWIADALPAEDAPDASLRLAAALLALATMRGEPNMRADQAMNWALRKRWIGLDARGRAMLAMAVLANSKVLDPPDPLTQLAGDADLKLAAAWGLGIRLCRKLTGGAHDALKGTALRREKDALVLHFAHDALALNGNSVDKNLKRLADWLDMDWRVETTTEPVA